MRKQDSFYYVDTGKIRQMSALGTLKSFERLLAKNYKANIFLT